MNTRSGDVSGSAESKDLKTMKTSKFNKTTSRSVGICDDEVNSAARHSAADDGPWWCVKVYKVV